MIWTIAIIFALVWVIGLVTATTLGGAIHALAAVAFVLLLVGAFQAGTRSGRRQGTARPTPTVSPGAAPPVSPGAAAAAARGGRA